MSKKRSRYTKKREESEHDNYACAYLFLFVVHEDAIDNIESGFTKEDEAAALCDDVLVQPRDAFWEARILLGKLEDDSTLRQRI